MDKPWVGITADLDVNLTHQHDEVAVRMAAVEKVLDLMPFERYSASIQLDRCV